MYHLKNYLLKAVPQHTYGGAGGERRCSFYTFMTFSLGGSEWSKNHLLHTLILQQNTGIIKAEEGVDILNEDDSTGVKTDEVYIPSAHCLGKPELEVSFVLRLFLFVVHVYGFTTQITYSMTFSLFV
jgi:hypothetical protein